jgi:Peptidase family M23
MKSLSYPRYTALLALALAAGPTEAIELGLPITCEIGVTCEVQNYVDLDPSSQVLDYQCGSRTYDGHKGIDFRLPSLRAQRAGVNVLAAAPGRVLSVRDGVPDISVRERGIGAVDGRECGNGVVVDHGEGWSTQYCHMAKGSLLVKSGDRVEGSQPLGRVGLSGMTEYPHLHFAVTFQGKFVEPFAFEAPQGSCGGGRPLWAPSLQSALAYKPRAVLNTGFTNGKVNMKAIEAGDVPAPQFENALVAYVRALGMKAGDIQTLQIAMPDGRILVENSTKPLDRDQAQAMMFVGKEPPTGGWPRGIYRATYTISHDNTVVFERSFTSEL